MKNFGTLTAQILRIIEQHQDAAGYDAGYDGGEFSGPAHDRMMQSEISELLRTHDLTVSDYLDAIKTRMRAYDAYELSLSLAH